MIDFISVVFCILGILLTINLLFSLLYLISKSAGHGLYRWIVFDFEFLMILAFPFFGLTEYVASHVYERFNWFIARLLLILYSILLLILVVVSFMLFSHFADML